MRPLVFSMPAYTITFVVAFLVWVVPERLGAFWLHSARDPSARQQERGSLVMVLGAIVAGLLVGFLLAGVWKGAAIAWFRPQVTITGIVLMLVGVALRW